MCIAGASPLTAELWGSRVRAYCYYYYYTILAIISIITTIIAIITTQVRAWDGRA